MIAQGKRIGLPEAVVSPLRVGFGPGSRDRELKGRRFLETEFSLQPTACDKRPAPSLKEPTLRRMDPSGHEPYEERYEACRAIVRFQWLDPRADWRS